MKRLAVPVELLGFGLLVVAGVMFPPLGLAMLGLGLIGAAQLTEGRGT